MSLATVAGLLVGWAAKKGAPKAAKKAPREDGSCEEGGAVARTPKSRRHRADDGAALALTPPAGCASGHRSCFRLEHPPISHRSRRLAS